MKYEVNIKDFANIPGCNFNYWISKQMMLNFTKLLSSSLNCKTGLICGNNDKYIKYWYGVADCNIGFNYSSLFDTSDNIYSWFPYNHGGEKRKWYGSHLEVVYLKNKGQMMSNEKNSMFRNSDFYFRKGITWNRVGSGIKFAARIAKSGFVFDDVSPSGFCNEDEYLSILGYMNSIVFNTYLRLFSNGLKVEIGQISNVPYKSISNDKIDFKSKQCIELEKKDWDSFEISWDFKKHPLI